MLDKWKEGNKILEDRTGQDRTGQDRTGQDRDKSIDIAKGLGMVLVIFGHLSERTQVLRILAYSFHMPLFFLISGFLMNTNRIWTESIKKDFSKLIIPAYEILLLDVMIYTSKYCIVGGTSETILQDWIKGILLYGGVLWNSPIWFLMTLFLCKYLFIFCTHRNKSLPYLFAIICTVLCCIDFNRDFPAWWPFNTVMSFPFFAIGVFVKDYGAKIESLNGWMSVPLTMAWMALALYNGYTDIHIQMNGKNYFLFLMTGLIGSYLCISLASLIHKTRGDRIFESIGCHSFVVLITHYYVCRGLLPKVLSYMEIESDIWLQCIMTLAIVLLYYGIFLLSRMPVILAKR